MYLENTTERVLHAVFLRAPSTGGDPQYVMLAPGCHDALKDGTIRVLEQHPTNRLFFDSGMLKVHKGPRPANERLIDGALHPRFYGSLTPDQLEHEAQLTERERQKK